MASKTEIANRALKKAGAGRINDILTDANKRANAINDIYSIVRDATLSQANWNFATKRAILAPTGNTPAWGYAYEYALPTDFLVIQEVKNTDTPDSTTTRADYREENGKILTNVESTIYLKYTARIENEGLFSASFVEAFATAMAYEVVEELTQSNTKKQLLAGDLRNMMMIAKRSDGFGQLPDKLDESEWITVRT